MFFVVINILITFSGVNVKYILLVLANWAKIGIRKDFYDFEHSFGVKRILLVKLSTQQSL